MPKTTPRTKPIDLTAAQSRHLSQHRRLLVVIPVDEQPNFGPTARPKPWCVNGHWQWRRCNPWTTFTCPYQPGDIVPCRERHSIVMGERDPTGRDPDCVFYESDKTSRYFDYFTHELVEASDFFDLAMVECCGDGWQPARTMPPWAIRHRPVVESVECRRVGTITGYECESAGFMGRLTVGSMIYEFVADWHRRYRRRGEAYSFDKVWGWFYTLVLK